MEVSFSIDLTGSTQAKQIINDCCDSEKKKREYLFSYHQILIQTELALYRRAIRTPGMLEKLFLVKSLGDEYWFTIDIDPETESNYLLVIFDYLYDITSSVNRIYIKSNTTRKGSKLPDVKNIICLGYKATIDALVNSYDFSSERLDYMLNNLFKADTNIKLPKRITAKPSKFDRILGNLNIGVRFKNTKKSSYFSFRNDPIGISVDRFFRLTQNTFPGILLIGNDLVDCFNLSFEDNRIILCVKEHSSKKSYNYFPAIKHLLSKQKMKGVSKDYPIYYIPSLIREGLTGIITRCDTDDLFKKTRQFLLSEDFLNANYSRNLDKWHIRS